MKPETLEALRGSIAKWQAIVDSVDASDQGAHNCPLCDLFFCAGECEGCPVSEFTGISGCGMTPYGTWASHLAVDHGIKKEHPLRRVEGCAKCLELAKAERDFLVGLGILKGAGELL